MENKNSPAYSISAYTDPMAGHGQNNTHPGYKGLTKREYIAAKAMQGLLSNDEHVKEEKSYPEITAEISVQYADALLKELEK